jgi:hypothetical protein
MAYPKFHGITLANGSVIENLHIERLAADPTPVTAGRIWVNTTEKKVKFTGLDDTGAVVIHSFSSAAELTAGVADAKAYTDAQITALKGVAPELLDTLGEIAAALNKDPNVYNTLVSMMGTNIDAAKAELRGAVSDAFDTLAELEQGLSDEVAARTAAVTAEANARTAADTALQNSIDGLTADLAAEVAAREAADTALDGRVSTVEGQVNGKIGDLTTLTTDAKSTIVGAVNELDAHVDAEVARAQAAEQQLTTNLAAEVTRAQAAETALSASVAQEVADRQTAVANEASARAAADSAIRSDVNAGKFVFVASSAALTHTVQHNLNTSPVLVSVYTEGDDGKFRNDIVAVEETNNNTITIGLTESRKVKVAVMSLAAI